MLLPGVAETIQFIDGDPDLPALRAARRFRLPVAFGVPALAFAAVQIAGMNGDQKAPLAGRLAEILENAITGDNTPYGDRPGFPLFSFRASEINIFIKLHAIIGDTYSISEMQMIAIAMQLPEVRLLLASNDRNRQMARLVTLPKDIAWIYPGDPLPGA